MSWGNVGREQGPAFIPRAALCLVPITVAAGKVVTIDATGVSNDGAPIAGTPKLQDFQVIEWTVAADATAQSYLDANTTKLSAPVTQRVDGVGAALTSYNIKNTGTGAIILHIWGM